MRPRRGLLVMVLALVAIPQIAGAEPTRAELDQARERFAAGRKLEDEGRWAEALDLFQKVAAVKMTAQVRFHLALCLENVGMLTQALDGFTLAERDAGDGDPVLVKESEEHKRDLQKQIPTITIRVDGAGGGDQLWLDRRSIPMGDPPLPLRVDPGPHTAEVRRGDEVIARQLFMLPKESAKVIDLTVGKVDAVVEPPKPPVDPPPVTAAIVTEPDRPDGGSQRTWGAVAMGAGVASAVVMGVFIGLRASKLDDLQKACPAMTKCPASIDSIVSAGKTDAVLVDVFGVAAGVFMAGGVVLFATAPRVTPVVGPRAAGLSVRGSF